MVAREPAPPDVLALFGPTAVGKTDVALALSDALLSRGERAVAVAADALQVYRGLEILTGVATEAERARLEHRLVSFLPITESFSVGRYAQLAHSEIDGLLASRRRPLVVGGTGLYLRAALTDLELAPPPAPGVREHWLRKLEEHGAPALHATLEARAPWAAERIGQNDRQRIVRALELLDVGELSPPERLSQLWSHDLRRPTLLVGMTMERQNLYERIDRRVDQMIADGVEDEVRRADAAGPSITARRALGFTELLEGDVEGFKRRTRNYARRQLTWMRKLAGAHVLDITGRSPEAVAEEILALSSPRGWRQ
jgi:tRNA dimethylallyltransferase